MFVFKSKKLILSFLCAGLFVCGSARASQQVLQDLVGLRITQLENTVKMLEVASKRASELGLDEELFAAEMKTVQALKDSEKKGKEMLKFWKNELKECVEEDSTETDGCKEQ